MLQAKQKSDYSYSYINNKEPKQNSRKSNLSISGVIVFLLTVILIGSILVSYICQFVQIAHLNYTINDLQQKLQTIKNDNYKLNVKLAQNKSMARIEKIARNDLHMVEPKKVEVIVMNDAKDNSQIVTEQKKDEFFLARVFNNVLDKIGNVKAEGLH